MSQKSIPVIFHFVTWYPSASDHVNGIFIRRHIELLAADRSFRHIIIRKSEKEISIFRHILSLIGFFRKDRMGKIEVIQLPHNSFLYRKFFWRYRKTFERIQLDRLIKKYKPKIVHLHVVYGFAKEALYIKAKHSIKYIVSEHMAPFPFDWITDLKGLVIDPVKNAEAVVAVSSAQANQIRAFTGVQPLVIPNVVSDKEFNHFPADKQPTKNINVVLVGIYDNRKGADYLISVFEAFSKIYANAVLHLVGEADADRKSSLMNLVEKNGLANNTVFHGRLSALEICTLYNQCDFYVCPSTWESFGVSVLEALYTGLPVLTTNCGGVG